MKITGAKIYTDNHVFEEGTIYTDEDRISPFSNDDMVLDADGLLAIPGLVDIHFHGAVANDFCDSDIEGISTIAKYEAQHGILAICPATMTYGENKLSEIMKTAKKYYQTRNSDPSAATFVGVNMEGPFISPYKVGAQNPDFLQLPNGYFYEKLQKDSGNLIKLLDMAPELTGSMDFIKEYSKEVNISLAHSNTDYDTAILAFHNGARHMTHLFNAMPGINHRNPGPIVAAKECNAEIEIIADGIHIHPAIVRLVFDMFDEDKVCLISDSMEATGLPDGEYHLGGQSVTVCGNKATLTNNESTIAGSVTNLFDCMKNAVQNMDIPIEAAVRAASETPAKAIGIDKDFGSLSIGKYANVLLIDTDMNIKCIINKGIIL
ncbi:N-acetylglucosamine-6-phosphate deacetylase [Butyrivibrio sp. AE3004]|uniref:N-acetylglucosamine-6-phosphate deacetylase n=1 Tax=Butyrivibrio sp. AE3004 TaxID=1506994 RepID=UPI000493FEB7|nr:N-acetylglucosamine-6-phosphate deacetylase [Butyrivibrio sp. AE3004]